MFLKISAKQEKEERHQKDVKNLKKSFVNNINLAKATYKHNMQQS